MHRRQFIKVLSGGTTTILLPAMTASCGDSGPQETGLEAWQGPKASETDLRRIILSYAILAPSPHNIQPWLVDLTGPNSMDLYVDQDRLLPETDPPFRQIHIAQGTFLENLEIAARQFGVRADVQYFPKGGYSNTVVERKPVASITLTPDVILTPDMLFSEILERQSNKRVYDGIPLSEEQLEALLDITPESEGLTLHVTEDEDEILFPELIPLLGKAMAIEVASKARDAETIAMFRFNDAERARYRDGFGLAQNGVGGVEKWLAESFFLLRENVEQNSTDFGKQAVRLTREQAQTATAFGWITSASNERLDQVLAGRLYERVHLTATKLGVELHPMSQAIEEYPAMAETQKALRALLSVPDEHTVQMLFRLGIATPVEHTARRKLNDIISS